MDGEIKVNNILFATRWIIYWIGLFLTWFSTMDETSMLWLSLKMIQVTPNKNLFQYKNKPTIIKSWDLFLMNKYNNFRKFYISLIMKQPYIISESLTQLCKVIMILRILGSMTQDPLVMWHAPKFFLQAFIKSNFWM